MTFLKLFIRSFFQRLHSKNLEFFWLFFIRFVQQLLFMDSPFLSIFRIPSREFRLCNRRPASVFSRLLPKVEIIQTGEIQQQISSPTARINLLIYNKGLKTLLALLTRSIVRKFVMIDDSILMGQHMQHLRSNIHSHQDCSITFCKEEKTLPEEKSPGHFIIVILD